MSCNVCRNKSFIVLMSLVNSPMGTPFVFEPAEHAGLGGMLFKPAGKPAVPPRKCEDGKPLAEARVPASERDSDCRDSAQLNLDHGRLAEDHGSAFGAPAFGQNVPRVTSCRVPTSWYCDRT